MMKPIRISRTIAAPLELVFQTVSDVRNFRAAVPGITNIEFLSDQEHGVDTRFRETRQMHGRESTVELEVAELVENDRVRMISDTGGTIWDTVFTMSQETANVELKMHMDIKPYKFFAKIMTILISGSVAKAVESDMDAIKNTANHDPNKQNSDTARYWFDDRVNVKLLTKQFQSKN